MAFRNISCPNACVESMGIIGVFGPFFALTSSFLGGSAAAGGIAFVNSIGALGGFLGPFVIGILKERTGNYSSAMALLAGVLVMSALIVFVVGRAVSEPRLVSKATI